MRTDGFPGHYYAWLLLAVPLTFLLHEAAHWLMGQALGYDMRMSLNGAAPRSGGFASDGHLLLVSAAGPFVTLLQAVAAHALLRSRAAVAAYAFLFVAWFMRFAAAMVSLIHPNDEARISQMLGWGTWTLPVLVVGVLLLLLVSGHRILRPGWKANGASYLLCSAAFAILVYFDARATG